MIERNSKTGFIHPRESKNRATLLNFRSNALKPNIYRGFQLNI